MTKIFFERTGGFMGRKVSLEIDLDELSKEQAGTWYELLDDADFFDLPEDLIMRDIPDGFTYQITVKSKNGEHSVRCGDASVPDGLSLLVEKLSEQARTRR